MGGTISVIYNDIEKIMILKCTAPQEMTNLRELVNEKALSLNMSVAILTYDGETKLQQVAVLFLNHQTCLKIPLLQFALEEAKIIVEPIEEQYYGIWFIFLVFTCASWFLVL